MPRMDYNIQELLQQLQPESSPRDHHVTWLAEAEALVGDSLITATV